MWRHLRRLAADGVSPLLILGATVFDLRTAVWPTYAGRDVEIYAVIARYWQDGLLPYRDLYDFKPPLTYVALRVAWALWGPGADSLRRLLLLAAAAGAIVAYVGLRRAGQTVGATVTATAFVTLVVADPWRIVSQNTELVTVPFAIAAFGCAAAYHGGGNGLWAVCSGVCVALAALAKQPAALWVLPVALQLALRPVVRHRTTRGGTWAIALLSRTALLLIGCAVPLGAVALYFAWHRAMPYFLEAVVTDGMRYAGLRPGALPETLLRPTAGLLLQVAAQPAMWPFVGAVLTLPVATLLRPSRAALVAWAWLLVSYVVVVVGPRSEWHYLICALPALALTLGTVVELTLGWGPTPPSVRQIVGSTLLAILLLGTAWVAHYVQVPLPSRGGIADLAEQIRKASHPGNTLFVRDEPFLLYVETGMRPPSRIIYLDAPTAGALAAWEGVLARKPTFIFVSHGTEARLSNAPDGFDGSLARLLTAEYERWLVHPTGVVYKHK